MRRPGWFVGKRMVESGSGVDRLSRSRSFEASPSKPLESDVTKRDAPVVCPISESAGVC